MLNTPSVPVLMLSDHTRLLLLAGINVLQDLCGLLFVIFCWPEKKSGEPGEAKQRGQAAGAREGGSDGK